MSGWFSLSCWSASACLLWRGSTLATRSACAEIFALSMVHERFCVRLLVALRPKSFIRDPCPSWFFVGLIAYPGAKEQRLSSDAAARRKQGASGGAYRRRPPARRRAGFLAPRSRPGRGIGNGRVVMYKRIVLAVDLGETSAAPKGSRGAGAREGLGRVPAAGQRPAGGAGDLHGLRAGRLRRGGEPSGRWSSRTNSSLGSTCRPTARTSPRAPAASTTSSSRRRPNGT